MNGTAVGVVVGAPVGAWGSVLVRGELRRAYFAAGVVVAVGSVVRVAPGTGWWVVVGVLP